MIDQKFEYTLSNSQHKFKKISYILFKYNICNLFSDWASIVYFIYSRCMG